MAAACTPFIHVDDAVSPAPSHVSEEEALEQVDVQPEYYGTQLRYASNAKAKSALGLALQHPDWRKDFRNLFD